MAQIPLRDRRGNVVACALVDDEDFDRVTNEGRWSRMGIYVGRRIRLPDGHTSSLSLHRFVLGLGLGDLCQVDHVNGDGRDCRKTNLRIGDYRLNAQNRRKKSDGKSPYRGVYWMKSANKWAAGAQTGNKKAYLGLFDSQEDAALAVAAWRASNMEWANEERPGGIISTLP